jgi:hypothetical protein
LANGDKNAAAVKAVETRANFMMMLKAKGGLSVAGCIGRACERKRRWFEDYNDVVGIRHSG